MVLLCAIGLFALTGCIQINKEAVQALQAALASAEADGDVALHDPAIHVYWTTKTGAEIVLSGVNARGNGAVVMTPGGNVLLPVDADPPPDTETTTTTTTVIESDEN